MSLVGRRGCAVAGIGYVVLAGIENLDVLGAPGLSSPIAEVARIYSEDRTQLVVTTLCGTLSLVCYLVFVVGLWSLLRAREAAGGVWSAVALAGGVGATLISAIGQVAHIALVIGGAEGARDDPDLALTLYHLDLRAQALAGALLCLFVLGVGMAGLRTRAIPVWLAGAALGLAPLALAVSLTVASDADAARAAVVAVFGVAALWVLAASVWLLLDAWEPARGDRPSMTLARVMFGTVGVAAGISGIVLLAAPSATADYFAWGLAPAPLAALIGGFYVASSVVYLLAAGGRWRAGRGLAVGILALTVPIFAATMIDLHLFDFGRLPAWAWVVLFGVFPVAAIMVLAGQRGDDADDEDEDERRFGTAVRAGLIVLAVPLFALAIALWADPVGGSDYLPFAPPSLSGRVLGSWAFLLGVLAAWSAVRDRAGEAWLALVALAVFPIGALIAASRTYGDLDAHRRGLYVVVLVAWLAVALALVWASGARRTQAA